jgi:hypothetical protein
VKKTLYKKGCDPITLASQEAVDYHLNQGWFENEADTVEKDTPAMTTKPYIVGQEQPAPPESEVVKDLKEQLEAVKAEYAEFKTDVEEVIKGLNATIATLRDNGAKPAGDGFGLPPATPPPPPKPTRKR